MKKFQQVKASGNNYELGLAIGRQLTQDIQRVITNDIKILGDSYTKIAKQAQPYLDSTRKYFPQYLDELKGIADGAQVPFIDLFLGNCLEVANLDRIVAQNHCTIVALPTKTGYLLGHNEDAQAYEAKGLYLLKAKINGHKIFGLTYMDAVIGVSVAVNDYGLVQAINSLPRADITIGVPANFISRAVLDCKTLPDVERIFKNIPRASGYNHVLVQGNQLWNIEATSADYKIQKIRSEKYAHTNHYLLGAPNLDNPEINIEESKKRLSLARKLLITARDISDIQKLLSTKSPHPICNQYTIGSAVIDPQQQKAYIAYGKPNPESYYNGAY